VTDERIVDALRASRRVVFLTGAGVSAESGIPTFRDRQTGLWERFDAAELATPEAFERDAPLVWGWYEWRRALARSAQPNAAHRAIAAIGDRIPNFTLITQNVDDLHERAGSRDVVHLHGELGRSRCEQCGLEHRDPAGRVASLEQRRIDPPRCRGCGARVRPGVVWFGEQLPEDAWQRARDAAQRSELFFVCGTSSLVQPAASLTDLAIGAGALTVQINPNLTGIESTVSVALRGSAGAVLSEILAATWGVR